MHIINKLFQISNKYLLEKGSLNEIQIKYYCNEDGSDEYNKCTREDIISGAG